MWGVRAYEVFRHVLRRMAMALTDTPDNPSVTHRAPLRTQGQIYCGGDLAVDGASELDGAVTLNSTLAVTGATTLQGTAMTGSPVVVQRIVMDLGTNTAAGVHTGSVTLPAGAILLDIVVHAVALWDQGTSAALIVGDDTDPNGYFDAVNLKATDLLVGESISLVCHGGKAGAYIVGTLPTGHWEARYQVAARTIDAEITTVGTAATTGTTYIDVFYTEPSATYTTANTYVAS